MTMTSMALAMLAASRAAKNARKFGMLKGFTRRLVHGGGVRATLVSPATGGYRQGMTPPRFNFALHAVDGAARTGTISMRRGEI
ncbi:MAG: hypothetical protein ACRYG4_23025, partial [Janthinobacterium lividum]